jgi:tetratricopeptide (TPR) repeat protein
MNGESGGPMIGTRSVLAAAIISASATGGLFGQDTAAPTPPQAPAAAVAATPQVGKLLPVFPPEDTGLVFVEGEEAVSTNMANEPTLNYGCSGNRSLQLARAGKLPGDRPFYAEYSVYVDRPGRYELWYGGTPPGPKDEFLVSLSSPVGISVDEAPVRTLYREDVNVIEHYTPAYYWNRTIVLELAAGTHLIRFEIGEKRRIDDRYVFYIDAFFLVDASVFGEGSARPDLFPVDLADRSLDKPFRSVEDYQAFIQANPTSVQAYVELSIIYSLAGDYISALKTLSRASVLAPKDPTVRLLVAKNRIWRGDVKEGLAAYLAYLAVKSDDRRGYEEAGKVAAWSGRYPESEEFYRTGLAAFPGDLSLTVNLGLTQLWASDSRAAEKSFAQAESAALADPVLALRLAAVYASNGYPDRAVAFYEKAIAAFPDRLELYLRALRARPLDPSRRGAGPHKLDLRGVAAARSPPGDLRREEEPESRAHQVHGGEGGGKARRSRPPRGPHAGLLLERAAGAGGAPARVHHRRAVRPLPRRVRRPGGRRPGRRRLRGRP